MLTGVPTRTNAEQALSSLLSVYDSIHPDSTTLLPRIDADSQEDLSRLVCSILLTGDAVQWGHSIGVFHALHGLLDYLDCSYLRDIKDIPNDEIDTAIWMTLRAVPERSVSECRKIIRRYIRLLADGDLREARDADGDHVRQFISQFTEDPVPAIFILRTLGHPEVRPLPTVGASLLLMRLEVTSALETSYFTEGYPAVQEEARRVLERHPIDLALMSEWWGLGHCPESCPVCPARMRCPELCRTGED